MKTIGIAALKQSRACCVAGANLGKLLDARFKALQMLCLPLSRSAARRTDREASWRGCLLQACRDRSWASLAAPSATVVDLLQYQAMAERYLGRLC